MADEKYPQFSESDDMARARAFWKESGKSIVFGISLGLAGIVGFNFWKYHEESQGEQASSLYQQVLSGTGYSDAQTASETLKMEFGDTVYAAWAHSPRQRRLLKTRIMMLQSINLNGYSRTSRTNV